MKMLLFIAALALYAALSGCAHTTAPLVTEVKIPITEKCQAPVPAAPVFAVDLLPVGSDIYQQVKALRAEREQRRGYELELETAVKACR